MIRKLTLVLFISIHSLCYSNTLTVTNSNDNSTGSLRSAIANATNGDTIYFNPSLANQTITLSTTLEIPVGKNLTIDGINAPNLQISGNNAVRVFLLKSTSVTPTSLSLRNLTIINGLTTEYGAGVRSEHQGVLYISNCIFRNNNAHQGGSAIFSHFEGRSTIENCTFTENVSIATNNERGSTVMLWGPFNHVVRNCIFTNNRGINGGAINGLNAQLLIENCSFNDNKTTDAVNNGGTNPTLRGFGGAIYVDRASPGGTSTVLGGIIIRSCNFQRNEAQSDGGACYIYTDATDSVIIDKCTFNANKVYQLTGGTTPTGGSGGAVEQMNNTKNKGFTVTNSTFSNNEAAVNCGAIRADWADTKIENCTFYNNKALLTTQSGGTSANGGALGFYSMAGSTVDIFNCTFANNHAGWVGGAIVTTHAANTRVKNSIFFQNTSANGGNTWNIQQHTNALLVDLGNNLQFPNKFTNNGNDYNVTATITIADPLLLPLADNGGPTQTMALQAGSPAIDAGSGCSSTDQRGATRVGVCDIGAYEYNGVLSIHDLNSNNNQIISYPNPSYGNLYVDIKTTDDVLVKIYSLDGKIIWAKKYYQTQILDIDFASKGIYNLYIETTTQAFTKRIIIK